MIKIEPKHQDQINQVCKLASPRASIQALANVLIDASGEQTKITAGDGKIEMNSVLDCTVKTGGKFTVDAQKFMQVLGVCGYTCDITIKDGYIQVKSGSRKFKLTTLDPESYPAYEQQGDQIPIGASLADIKAASVSCGQGDARAFLNGVHIGEIIAASDGHRITTASTEPLTPGIIIPAESIKKAPNGDPEITTDGRTVTIKYENGEFKSRLIDAKYPSFDKAILPSVKHIEVDADELSDAIKAAMITNEQVKIEFDGKNGRVSGTSKNNDETDIGFSASGDEVAMRFNARYLIDALSFYAGNTRIGFNDNQLIIEGAFTNVVMCVRD